MGRPREFKIEKAVKAATALFWQKGYEGTSLADLTRAIGICAPSFYFAFGSKENLFRKVIERYNAKCATFIEAAMLESTAQAVVQRFLVGYADLLTDSTHAPGCLAMNSAFSCSENGAIRDWLASQREGLRQRLIDRFAQARENGEVTANDDCDSLARFVVTTAWGLAIEAQSGASREELHRTIDLALTSTASVLVKG